jgi:hypothetical protein
MPKGKQFVTDQPDREQGASTLVSVNPTQLRFRELQFAAIL